jgi:hypothetical protein
MQIQHSDRQSSPMNYNRRGWGPWPFEMESPRSSDKERLDASLSTILCSFWSFKRLYHMFLIIAS